MHSALAANSTRGTQTVSPSLCRSCKRGSERSLSVLTMLYTRSSRSQEGTGVMLECVFSTVMKEAAESTVTGIGSQPDNVTETSLYSALSCKTRESCHQDCIYMCLKVALNTCYNIMFAHVKTYVRFLLRASSVVI